MDFTHCSWFLLLFVSETLIMETLFPANNSDDKKPVKEGGREGDDGAEQNSAYQKPVKEGAEGEDGPEQYSKSWYSLQEMMKKIQADIKTLKVAVALSPNLNTNGSSLPTATIASSRTQVHSSTSNNEPSQMNHIQLPPSFSTSSVSSSSLNNQDGVSSSRVDNVETIQKRFLFKKVLNNSDTGKLNRLLIPRKDAENHFPSLGQGDGHKKRMTLKLSDNHNKTWEMKFEFWSTSRCYVLSTGWKKFVTAYTLEAHRHVVNFYKIDQVSDDKLLFIDFTDVEPPTKKTIRLFGQNLTCEYEEGSNGTKGGNGEGDKRKRNQTASSRKRQTKFRL